MSGPLKAWVGSSAVAGGGAMVVFGLAHQVLVAPTPAVFVGIPIAMVLSVPLIAGYRAEARASGSPPGGIRYGSVVAAGLLVQFVLVMLAMRGRTFEQGPDGLLYAAGLVAAAVVPGGVALRRYRLRRTALFVALGSVLIAAAVGDFQASEPDLANVGAAISTAVACIAGGALVEWSTSRWRPPAADASSPPVAARAIP